MAHDGALAQLGERLLCKQEVVGSIPTGSTPRLMLRKLAPTAVVAALLAGCTNTEIDSEKAESFVRDNVPGAFTAECPDGVEANKGETFECRVDYADGRRATVTVRIRDDDGRVSIGPGDVRPER